MMLQLDKINSHANLKELSVWNQDVN